MRATYVETCPHCGNEQKALPPGVMPSHQRHCQTGCGRYFDPNPTDRPIHASLDRPMREALPERAMLTTKTVMPCIEQDERIAGELEAAAG